jgi:hypothetical protein
MPISPFWVGRRRPDRLPERDLRFQRPEHHPFSAKSHGCFEIRTTQVKYRQQRLDRLRPARRREPDAAGIGGDGLAIAHTWLADGDRTDTGHHLALRPVTVADDALVAVPGLQIGMFVEKVRDLGLDRPGEQGTGRCARIR